MATHHGNSGVVKVGANTVAEVTEFSLTITQETADDTAMGDAARTHKPGVYSWTAEVTCHWDETDTNGQETMDQGASVTLNLYPEGAGSGAVYFSGTATITTIALGVPMAGIVSRRFTAQGNGALSQTTV